MLHMSIFSEKVGQTDKLKFSKWLLKQLSPQSVITFVQKCKKMRKKLLKRLFDGQTDQPMDWATDRPTDQWTKELTEKWLIKSCKTRLIKLCLQAHCVIFDMHMIDTREFDTNKCNKKKKKSLRMVWVTHGWNDIYQKSVTNGQTDGQAG